jgi:hypothetical protein
MLEHLPFEVAKPSLCASCAHAVHMLYGHAHAVRMLCACCACLDLSDHLDATYEEDWADKGQSATSLSWGKAAGSETSDAVRGGKYS